MIIRYFFKGGKSSSVSSRLGWGEREDQTLTDYNPAVSTPAFGTGPDQQSAAPDRHQPEIIGY